MVRIESLIETLTDASEDQFKASSIHEIRELYEEYLSTYDKKLGFRNLRLHLLLAAVTVLCEDYAFVPSFSHLARAKGCRISRKTLKELLRIVRKDAPRRYKPKDWASSIRRMLALYFEEDLSDVIVKAEQLAEATFSGRGTPRSWMLSSVIVELTSSGKNRLSLRDFSVIFGLSEQTLRKHMREIIAISEIPPENIFPPLCQRLACRRAGKDVRSLLSVSGFSHLETTQESTQECILLDTTLYETSESPFFWRIVKKPSPSVKRLQPLLEDRNLIYDIGAGVNLRNTMALVRLGKKLSVVAADLLSVVELIEQPPENVQLVPCKLPEYLPTNGMAYDCAILSYVLHHIQAKEDRERILERIRGLLKDNGYLCLDVRGVGSLDDLGVVLKQPGFTSQDYIVDSPHGAVFYHFYFPAEIFEELRRTGFEILWSRPATAYALKPKSINVLATKIGENLEAIMPPLS